MSFETRANFDASIEGYEHEVPPAKEKLSHYELQKRRDWNSFCQFVTCYYDLPVHLEASNNTHVIEFLNYLDQFGKTKIHLQECEFFGVKEPAEACNCPLRQAWGSLDARLGRLRAAYEEKGGRPDLNPFASAIVKTFLRQVKEYQSIARGISYAKKKQKKNHVVAAPSYLD